MNKLLEFLREQREALEFSQEYMADMMNVSSRKISRWERGLSEMKFSEVIAYSQYLDISLERVFAVYANQEALKYPVAEITFLVYSNDAFAQIMSEALRMGLDEIIVKQTNKY